MILFHSFVTLLLFVVSLNSSEEINDHTIKITDTKSDVDNGGILSSSKQLNSSYSIAPWTVSSTIPSKNLEAYMSTVIRLFKHFLYVSVVLYNTNGKHLKVEIIVSRGYHAEMHPVTTDDDYILMLHRIPYPKGRTSGPVTGRPVFVQHGFGESSADWVLLPSDKSLGEINKN